MDAYTLGTIVADYLRDRDDIATAAVIKEITSEATVIIGVETQGGGRFGIVITAGSADV